MLTDHGIAKTNVSGGAADREQDIAEEQVCAVFAVDPRTAPHKLTMLDFLRGVGVDSGASVGKAQVLISCVAIRSTELSCAIVIWLVTRYFQIWPRPHYHRSER